MSELLIQQGIQTVLRAMSAFADADVVINDWGVLDQSTAHAPYVIISTADDFVSRQDVQTPETTWQIPVTLCEVFTDWTTTLNNLRARRQAIIDEFNTVGTARSANGQNGVTIDELRNDGPITPFYDPYVPAERQAEALPLFVNQTLLMTVQEF